MQYNTDPSLRKHAVSPMLAKLMQKADVPVTSTVPSISWNDAHTLRVRLSEYIVHVSNMAGGQLGDLNGPLRDFVHPERWNELLIISNAISNDLNNASTVIGMIADTLFNFKGAVLETDYGVYSDVTARLTDCMMKTQALVTPALITISGSVYEALANKKSYDTPEAFNQAMAEGKVVFNRITEPYTVTDATAFQTETGLVATSEVVQLPA